MSEAAKKRSMNTLGFKDPETQAKSIAVRQTQEHSEKMREAKLIYADISEEWLRDLALEAINNLL